MVEPGVNPSPVVAVFDEELGVGLITARFGTSRTTWCARTWGSHANQSCKVTQGTSPPRDQNIWTNAVIAMCVVGDSIGPLPASTGGLWRNQLCSEPPEHGPKRSTYECIRRTVFELLFWWKLPVHDCSARELQRRPPAHPPPPRDRGTCDCPEKHIVPRLSMFGQGWLHPTAVYLQVPDAVYSTQIAHR